MTDYKISEEELDEFAKGIIDIILKGDGYNEEAIHSFLLLKSKKPIEPLNRDNVDLIIDSGFSGFSTHQGYFENRKIVTDAILSLSPQPEPSNIATPEKEANAEIQKTLLRRISFLESQLAKPSGEVIAEGIVYVEEDCSMQNRFIQASIRTKDIGIVPLGGLLTSIQTRELEGTKIKLIIHKCKESK